MKTINHPAGKTPSLNGAVVLSFPSLESADALRELLPYVEEWRNTVDGIEITYRKVDSFSCWHMEDLLTELFSQYNISQIVHAVNTFDGEVLIDLWFYHYDSYPSLSFSGKNMEIIRQLHADISIDPY